MDAVNAVGKFYVVYVQIMCMFRWNDNTGGYTAKSLYMGQCSWILRQMTLNSQTAFTCCNRVGILYTTIKRLYNILQFFTAVKTIIFR